MAAKANDSGRVNRPQPPPLPPRQGSQLSGFDSPPSYDEATARLTRENLAAHLSGGDPRSSSTQSLTPSDSNQQNDRRRLMLIYIHGFMGNETSFRSFPAHVHNLLTALLAETHVIHSKIYPRYRSKKNISFARDDFSKWLEPHEGRDVDVVLCGHSMGGLLAAEVALMPPPPPGARPFKHRILGTINFDVPFLGMHPGVVKSGLASIFSPPDKPQDNLQSDIGESSSATASQTSSMQETPNAPPRRTDTLFSPENPDPNYNPSFQNDVILPMRKGWRGAWHFVNKHSGELRKATTQLVTSHMEFGGAMANYGELKMRYARIRALEETSDQVRRSVIQGQGNELPPRVRFINYYTISTGRTKRAKSPESGVYLEAPGATPDISTLNLERSRSPSPSISVELHSDDGKVVMQDIPPQPEPSDDEQLDDAAETLRIGSPPHGEHEQRQTLHDTPSYTSTATASSVATLPPLPDLPPKPAALDVSYIQDKDTRKLVEKEHSQAVKAYEKAVKHREKVINERAKLEEKQARKSQKESTKGKEKVETKEMTHADKEQQRLEQEKLRMENEARRMRGETPLSQLPSTTSAKSADRSLSVEEQRSPRSLERPMLSSTTSASSLKPVSTKSSATSAKPKKERTFCTLPPADSLGGRDPCWVKVFMENVDEVGAHCGLFFIDERYERLVGDVAERVERWVNEDMGSRRASEWSSMKG